MTVIRDKQNYSYPKPSSNTNSDTESLHLGSVPSSDTESLNGESTRNRHHVYRPPPVRVSHLEEVVNIKKSSGKKKIRRYNNRCVLHTLNEEEENEDFIVIMESYKSPFARLLEDPSAFEYWNAFIEKTEEEQTEIIRALTEKFDNHIQSTNDNKHGKLSSRIRRTIKIKKNLSLEAIQELENDLIEFFKATPQDVYIKYPLTSFDRLLLHAIAQYHRLKSLSMLSDDAEKRLVKVHNTESAWMPADSFLTDFIKELRA